MQPCDTIGSHLCERLLAEGNDIICIDNYFTGHKSNIRHLLSHPNFEVIRHDIVYPYMAEIEEIYNLACPASPIYYQHDPIKTTQTSVIGSINMDLVVGTPRFPAPGETITGSIFRSVPGGKGANQAVALARLGVETRMAGMVGDDGFGQTYLEHFRKNGVNVEAVETRPGATTGLANILVSDDGENVIVLVPGANALCDGEWLERALAQTAQCDIFLLQLELPLDTVCKCVERLHAAGKTVVLDPAPAVPLPAEWLACADYITPNETELEILEALEPDYIRGLSLLGGEPLEPEHQAALLPLLQELGCPEGVDEAYWQEVLGKTRTMAEAYPLYLSTNAPAALPGAVQLSERSVKYQCEQAYHKLGTSNKVEALAAARKLNLL